MPGKGRRWPVFNCRCRADSDVTNQRPATARKEEAGLYRENVQSTLDAKDTEAGGEQNWIHSLKTGRDFLPAWDHSERDSPWTTAPRERSTGVGQLETWVW